MHALELTIPPTAVASVMAGAHWRVSSLAEACARLERAGATLYRGPLVIGNGEAICQVSDPFGNLLGLIGTNGGG
jgi:predicted enzyme related to lactoylglutathione lyase